MDTDHSVSFGSVCLLSGSGITLWSSLTGGTETMREAQLRLEPDAPVILGRAEGWDVPYLDPTYRATAIVPSSGQRVLNGSALDGTVSRAHLTLRRAAGGILLVNGVPRRGGGVRPPLNGTVLLAPAPRPLGPGEEYLIASGAAVVLRLPNSAEIQIAAA
ncbi:MAG: hypothetical protein U0793_07365 [Gemmataceae bacterium]